MISFDYFRCPECQFDSIQESTFAGSETCPMCLLAVMKDPDMDVLPELLQMIREPLPYLNRAPVRGHDARTEG